MADELTVEVYRLSTLTSGPERLALQVPLRNAALRVCAQILAACARRSNEEYVRCVVAALDAALELAYLLELGAKLGLIPIPAMNLLDQAQGLSRALLKLADNSGDKGPRSLKPKGRSLRMKVPSVKIKAPSLKPKP